MTELMQLTYADGQVCLQEPEIAWIRAAQDGNLEAFNPIVLRYQGLLYRIASRILWDEAMAQDAVQDTFISAFRHISAFRGEALRSWLVRIVVNKCFDQLGSPHNSRTISLNDCLSDPDSDFCLDIRDDRLPLESCIENSERMQVIRACLDSMPMKFRSIIILADVEELGYKEISRILAIPIGTVKSSLARARLRLRGLVQRQRGLTAGDNSHHSGKEN